MKKPLVTIISPVKNALRFLPCMIRSVDKQSFMNWEHIIIDGNSSDGTLQYLRGIESGKRKVISELDSGLYDAVNKGLYKAKGDFFCVLNADDWYEPEFLEKAIKAIETSQADWVFGNNMFHYLDGTTRIVLGDPFYEIESWAAFTRFHHTTVLARRECFEAVGGFPLEVRVSKSVQAKLEICSDYKWFLMLQRAGFRGFYVREIMGHMRWGGISTAQQEKAHFEGELVALSEFGNRKRIREAWGKTNSGKRADILQSSIVLRLLLSFLEYRVKVASLIERLRGRNN